MKVLIVSTMRFDLNGVTNVILNYYRSMNKSGMQIDFVIPNDIRDDWKFELESLGSHIYQVNDRTKKPFAYFRELSKILKKNKYNLVHAHGNSCTLALEMYAAKKNGVRVRISHSHSSSNKYKLAHKLLRRLFDSSYTHGFACSHKAGEWLFNNKPYELINNGINTDLYTFNNSIRNKYREDYSLTGKKVIGHIGHFIYPKNHDFLIDVFYELYKIDSKYRLILIGDGQLKEKIQKKVDEVGLSNVILFMGRSNKVAELMQAIDIIVMPSHFEGLPLTLIEAQTACLPCYVSSNISPDAKVTTLVNFISLDNTPKQWAHKIHNSEEVARSEIKETVVKNLNHSGYSIRENAKRMKVLYETYTR